MTETGPAGPGRPPDLLFCRRCGESIARREFLSARALLLEGRAFCPRCVPATLGARRAARLAAGAGAAAAVALGVAGFVLLDGRAGAARAASAEAAAAGRAAAADARALGARLASLEAEVRGLSAVVAAAAAAMESSREDAEADGGRIDALERSLAEAEESLDALRAGRAAGGRLTSAEEERLEARMVEINAGERFSALVALTRGSGEPARRAAVKGLSDADAIVRRQAAILAASLAVREAVPGLVDLLEDASPLVRESAVAALLSLEGTDLGYDPLDPEDRRAAAVVRWRDRLAKR